MPIIILAHGALGAFDEIVFVSVAIIFVVMMAISWFRSQRLSDESSDRDDNTTFDEKVMMQETPDPERFELK